jgi:excinuclease UvrABC nuclease subunit
MMLLKTFNSIDEIKNSSTQKLISLGLPKKIAEELLLKLNTKE